jgi:hypothetical protein
MKVSELTGSLLDYWVARANGDALPRINNSGVCGVVVECEDGQAGTKRVDFCPSSDWSHGGPIIDRVRIATWHADNGWRAIHPKAMPSGYSGDSHYIDITEGDGEFSGGSLLVAAMRSYVASKFGDEVQDVEPASA